MVTKKRGSSGHAKEGRDAQDIRNLSYAIEAVNPIPAAAASILKLVAPILARVIARRTISSMIKHQLAKRVSPENRERIADAGANAAVALILKALEKVITK